MTKGIKLPAALAKCNLSEFKTNLKWSYVKSQIISATEIGIDPKEIEDLFVPFNMADSTTAELLGGYLWFMTRARCLNPRYAGFMWADGFTHFQLKSLLNISMESINCAAILRRTLEAYLIQKLPNNLDKIDLGFTATKDESKLDYTSMEFYTSSLSADEQQLIQTQKIIRASTFNPFVPAGTSMFYILMRAQMNQAEIFDGIIDSSTETALWKTTENYVQFSPESRPVSFPRQAVPIWSDFLHPLYQQWEMSHAQMLIDLSIACISAGLVGRSNHVLFANESIPLPRAASSLGWQQMSGIDNIRLTKAEQDYSEDWLGFRPKYLISFITPHMPATRDHNTGGNAVFEAGSNNDHSLPARSANHIRLENGSLDQGRAIFAAVLIGKGKSGELKSKIVTQQDVHGDSRRGQLNARDLMPWSYDSGTKHRQGKFVNTFDFPEKLLLSPIFTSLADPFVSSSSGIMIPLLDYAEGSQVADLGMRYLAKMHQIHFRFGTEGSQMAVKKWMEAYVEAAWYWNEASHWERESILAKDICSVETFTLYKTGKGAKAESKATKKRKDKSNPFAGLDFDI